MYSGNTSLRLISLTYISREVREIVRVMSKSRQISKKLDFRLLSRILILEF